MSSADVVASALEVGNKQFKLQKYEESIKIYSKAIGLAESLSQKELLKARRTYGLSDRPAYLKAEDKIHHPKLITLLDSRAAAYEKLQDYQKAIQDSQKAVSLEPYNAKGYIRMGKLLLSMKKEAKAYEVFSKGVKRIEYGVSKYKMQVNQNLFKHLESQKQNLKEQSKERERQQVQKETKPQRHPDIIKASETRGLARTNSTSSQDKKRVKTLTSRIITREATPLSQKSFDPLQYLPLEITTRIFDLLNLKTVLTCLRVSNYWNYTLSRIPSLYNNISISRFATLKHIQSCFELVLKSKRHSHIKSLQYLKVHSTRRTDERQILNYILNKSPICFTGSLDFSFVDVTTEQLFDCINGSRTLQKKLENLKQLKLSCVLIPGAEEKILEFLPNLESLELIKIPQNIRPSSLRRYESSEKSFRNLKKLTLIGDIKHEYPTVPFINLFLDPSRPFSNLESLTIVGYDFNSMNVASREFNFLQGLSKIQSLVFENNENMNLSIFLKSHDLLEFKDLRKFAMRENKIRYSEHLLNYDSFYLNKIFQNLNVLDLTGSSITWHGLSKILRVCGEKLVQLSIGYCQNIIFKKGPFRAHVNGGFFEFENFFTWCPKLQVLYLNQATDFNDYALTQMVTALKQQEGFKTLKLLDLSFNELSGYKLLDLVKAMSIEYLVLHGLDIHLETTKLMEKKYCKKVDNNIDKQNWREYGINSYNPF